VENKKGKMRACVKYWEIIADNLKKAGWSYGYVSAVDSEGRTVELEIRESAWASQL
jgi:hypothetical protein